MRWLLPMAGVGCVWRSATEPTERLALTSMQEVPDGGELFSRIWLPDDPRSAGGDGLGPMYNAASCEGCHFQGGVGGSGPEERNVLLQVTGAHTAVLHRASTVPGYQQDGPGILGLGRHGMLGLIGTGRRGGMPSARTVSRNTPALFGIGLLDGIDEADILAGAQESWPDWPEVSGRPGRTPTGALGRLGWKGEVATVAAFVEQACGVELGLQTPGQLQTPALHDPLGDSDTGLDMTAEEVAALAAFVAELPAPVVRTDELNHADGAALFVAVGCHTCHTPDLGGVSGVYSDLLLHDMGFFLSDVATAYGMSPASRDGGEDWMATAEEWRTPPLWGLRDSAPYLHDGRAGTIEVGIQQHGGEAEESVSAWLTLDADARLRLVDFLASLAAPTPRS